MNICLYEEWMKPQIAELFSNQYGISTEDFSELMDRFYEHPFQKDKCIRIVALKGEKVVGFQSFFYWPYSFNGISYNSFQSGNSLVHPDYRGKGIFQKLLNYLDLRNTELKIDFLVGFPVEASFKSFIKNKWLNPLNLVWYIKIINPLGFIFKLEKTEHYFDSNPSINTFLGNNSFQLNKNDDFKNWRNYFSYNHFYFNFNESDKFICFELKLNKRNRWFNELIIGDINTNSIDTKFLERAFSNLKKRALSMKSVSAITIAINEFNNDHIKNAINNSGFKRLERQINFIIKPMLFSEKILRPENWTLYRGDLDTW